MDRRSMAPPIIRMTRFINDYRARQYQHLIFLWCDLDSVSISPAEPLLRDGCNGYRASPEDILVVGKVSFRFQVVRPGYIDCKTMMEGREQVLLHNRRDLAIANDLVGLSPREYTLFDERKLVALEILERELIAKTEHLAVDEIEVAAGLVLDEEIVAERKQLLLQDVAHGPGVKDACIEGCARSRLDFLRELIGSCSRMPTLSEDQDSHGRNDVEYRRPHARDDDDY